VICRCGATIHDVSTNPEYPWWVAGNAGNYVCADGGKHRPDEGAERTHGTPAGRTTGRTVFEQLRAIRGQLDQLEATLRAEARS
jgi:hypothetical protein